MPIFCHLLVFHGSIYSSKYCWTFCKTITFVLHQIYEVHGYIKKKKHVNSLLKGITGAYQ